MFFPPQPKWAYGKILNIMARGENAARELQSRPVGRGARCTWLIHSVWWKMDLCPHPSLRINVKKFMFHSPAKFSVTDVFMVRNKFLQEPIIMGSWFLPLWPTIQTSVNLATSWMQFLIYSFNILAHNLELLTPFWVILFNSVNKKNNVYHVSC